MKDAFLDKIAYRKARAAVIGAGYVGLPLSTAVAEAGFTTTVIDVIDDKVAQVNDGVSYVGDVGSARLKALVTAGTLAATTDFSKLKAADAISICVPTPLTKTRDPDVSHILSATREIAKYLQPGALVVLESTTYPGTTREAILPLLEIDGRKVGKDFFLCFSPERIDPGNAEWRLQNTPKVIGGITAACAEVGAAYYRTFIETVVEVSTTESAEMVKLLENTFRAVNIAMVNEVAMMCRQLGLDTWEVIQAAASKPFGFMPFFPGPGLGGHCLPVDPLYLSWKLKTLNYDARFIGLASKINSEMPEHVVTLVTDALNDHRKPVNGSRILVLGVAYKRDIGDTRESPAIDILRLLKAKGAHLDYNDPHVPELQANGDRLKSVALDPDAIASYDCVIVVTDHSEYDPKALVDSASLLVDTRNLTSGLKAEGKIVRL